MKTLFGLALLAGFFWVLKVISDGLVDKVPDAWARKLANAKPEDYRDEDGDLITDPVYSSLECNVFHRDDD